MVSVEGGGDGVGIIKRMWEQTEDTEEESSDEAEGEDEGDRDRVKMAEIHWCFRREDLPGVMKNLNVADVSLSLGFGT